MLVIIFGELGRSASVPHRRRVDATYSALLLVEDRVAVRARDSRVILVGRLTVRVL